MRAPAWQASPPVDAALEAELLAVILKPLGVRVTHVPPTPAAALALLHTCGNLLCVELRGDSEAGVALMSCARCEEVTYCCR